MMQLPIVIQDIARPDASTLARDWQNVTDFIYDLMLIASTAAQLARTESGAFKWSGVSRQLWGRCACG